MCLCVNTKPTNNLAIVSILEYCRVGNSTLQPEILCQRNKCSRTSCHSESHVLWVFMTLRIARVVDFAGLFANETQASDESIEDVKAAVKQPLSNTSHSTVALVCKATTGNTAKCDEQQIQRNASLDGRPCQQSNDRQHRQV